MVMPRRPGASSPHPCTQHFLSSLPRGQGTAIFLGLCMFKRLLCMCTGVSAVTGRRATGCEAGPGLSLCSKNLAEQVGGAHHPCPSLLQAPPTAPGAALGEQTGWQVEDRGRFLPLLEIRMFLSQANMA